MAAKTRPRLGGYSNRGCDYRMVLDDLFICARLDLRNPLGVNQGQHIRQEAARHGDGLATDTH